MNVELRRFAMTSDHPWRKEAVFDRRRDARVPLFLSLPWEPGQRVVDSVGTLGLGRVGRDLLQHPLPAAAVIAGLTARDAPWLRGMAEVSTFPLDVAPFFPSSRSGR